MLTSPYKCWCQCVHNPATQLWIVSLCCCRCSLGALHTQKFNPTALMIVWPKHGMCRKIQLEQRPSVVGKCCSVQHRSPLGLKGSLPSSWECCPLQLCTVVISRNHLIWRELFSHSSGPFPWSGPCPITGPCKSGKTQTSYPHLARDSSKLLRLHHRHSSPSAASHFLLSPWQVLILRSSLTSFLHADSHPKVCFTGNLTCNTKPIWVSLHPKMTC